MTPAPVIDALGIAETAILTALNALAPRNSAAWGLHRPDTLAGLTLPQTGATRQIRLYTAQHQTTGTQRYAGAQWHRGEVLIKSLAVTDTAARAGLVLIYGAMQALADYAPAGSFVHATFLRVQDLPREVISVRGLLYTIEARLST